MVFRYSMTTRARARAAVRGMAADAQGPRLPRLPPDWRQSGHAICLQTVEFIGACSSLAGWHWLRCSARAPLAGWSARPDPNLAPGARRRPLRHPSRPHLSHARFVGVGLGFKGLTVRDAAGRTVLSAPSGKIGLDPFAAAQLDVRVRRLELDGLDLRLRVAADGALSLAVASDLGATPIPLPSPVSAGARRRRTRHSYRRRYRSDGWRPPKRSIG